MFKVNGNVMNPVAIAWLGVKQQNEPKAELMKFAFFATEIESDFQCLFECIVKGRGEGLAVGLPERSDAHRCGMPSKVAGFAD